MPGSSGELVCIAWEGILTTYPKIKNETVNVDNVVESLSNSAFIRDVAGANIDDAKGLTLNTSQHSRKCSQCAGVLT